MASLVCRYGCRDPLVCSYPHPGCDHCRRLRAAGPAPRRPDPLLIPAFGDPRKFAVRLRTADVRANGETEEGVVLEYREWGEVTDDFVFGLEDAARLRDWLDVLLQGEPRDG